MPRLTSPLPKRLAPFRRAAATAGLTVAALVVGAGGYTVATSPALAAAPGDRFPLADLFGGSEEAEQLDTAAVRRGDEQASRSVREPLAAGLPSTSAEAQSWVDEVAGLEAVLADKAAEEEAARIAAEKAAAEKAAAEKAAAEKAAAEKAAAEQAAAEAAAEEEAARVAAEQEASRIAEEEAAEQQEAAQQASADPGSSRAIAQSLLGSYGWGSDQWSCLDSLWQKESSWSHTADNPSSSAYGIPQALPGSKMSSAGSDWESNPETQIRWGLGYIDGRYGSPCSAWDHSVNNNWY